jgi:hypothetical protein
MFTCFNIGKNKKYKGLKIQIGWFKFERIWFKNLFMWRFELTNWR